MLRAEQKQPEAVTITPSKENIKIVGEIKTNKNCEVRPLKSGKVLILDSTSQMLKIWDSSNKDKEPKSIPCKDFKTENVTKLLGACNPPEQLDGIQPKSTIGDLHVNMYNLKTNKVWCRFPDNTDLCLGEHGASIFESFNYKGELFSFSAPLLTEHMQADGEALIPLSNHCYLQKTEVTLRILQFPNVEAANSISREEWLKKIVKDREEGKQIWNRLTLFYGKSLNQELLEAIQQIIPDELKEKIRVTIHTLGTIGVGSEYNILGFHDVLAKESGLQIRSDSQRGWALHGVTQDFVLDCNFEKLKKWLCNLSEIDRKKIQEQIKEKFFEVNKKGSSRDFGH